MPHDDVCLGSSDSDPTKATWKNALTWLAHSTYPIGSMLDTRLAIKCLIEVVLCKPMSAPWSVDGGLRILQTYFFSLPFFDLQLDGPRK